MKTLVVCSGGLDSVTLAYKTAKEYELSCLLSFDYGQRHKKEIAFAQQCAEDLNAPHQIIDISNIGNMLNGSALTDNVEVPNGHYAEEAMKITVVPNRNAIMLSIAYGIASVQGLDAIATAVHGGDHFIYPDCRPDFIHAFSNMQNLALEGISNITLHTPFLTLSKSDIAKEAESLSVPIEKTWSCYKGQEIHCGRCGTCVERIEACTLANIKDPTQYADTTYWKEAVKGAA